MKTQMRFQKIIMMVSLIIAALTIVYAFGFCTGAISYLSRITTATSNDTTNIIAVNAQDVYWLAQDYNDILLWLGIIYILIIALCYAFSGAKRRNYYIGNYVTMGIAIVYSIVWAVLAFVFTLQIQIGLSEVNWDAFRSWVDSAVIANQRRYSDDQTIYYLGYVLIVIVLADAAALIFNLIWKIKLMKGEKKLLNDGLVREVA